MSSLKCKICGGTHLARGLCEKHYHAMLNQGKLSEFPKHRGEAEEPPAREPWTYEPAAESELIAAQESRDAALQVLKDALQKTERLDDATKKKILVCNSEEEIRKILDSLPKRFPFRANKEGFLEFVG